MRQWVQYWSYYLCAMILTAFATAFVLQDTAIPQRSATQLSFLDILRHNAPFPIIFSIPFGGIICSIVSLLNSAIQIGISIHYFGLGHTVTHLVHFPIELFGLLGLLRVRFSKAYLKRLLLCWVILAVGALIESLLGG